MAEASSRRLSQDRGVRIAMAAVAAPLFCCFAGLAAVLLLKHYQAALAAEYAARHLTPWPMPQGWYGEPSSFLHGTEAGREVLVCNPAQWDRTIAGLGFVMVPVLLVFGALAAWAAWARNRLGTVGALLAMAGLVWGASPSLRGIVAGYDVVLDASHDALLLDGSRVAPLSDVVAFRSREFRREKGIAHELWAVLRDGRAVQVADWSGQPDLVQAGPALDAILRRLRGQGPAVYGSSRRFGFGLSVECPAGNCPDISPQDQKVLHDSIGAALDATAP